MRTQLNRRTFPLLTTIVGGILLVTFGALTEADKAASIAFYLVLIAGILIAVGLVGRARRRRLRWIESGLCPVCGYDPTGNVSGVCPECGTRIKQD